MNPAHYAVVIGINRYPGIRDLQLAKHDAKDFRKWLLDPDGGGVPEENIKVVMADQADEITFSAPIGSRPTLNEVNAAIQDVNRSIRTRVQAQRGEWDESRLYLYASGHGIAPEDGAAAVLMADADADPMVESYGNSIEISKYTQWYVGCGWFREVVVFADCCRDRRYTAPGTGPPMSRCPEPYGATNCATGFATTYATSAYEPTDIQDLDQARGYFTRALLDGLTGGAAGQSGEITTLTLADYIAASVKAQTEGKPFKQQPSMPLDGARPIVFRAAGTPTRRHTRTVTLKFPEGFAGRVSLICGRDFSDTGKSWTAGDGPWSVELEEGFYSARADDPPAGGFKGGGLFRVIARDADVEL